MSIQIDQRSDVSAFIQVGDITIYVEHSDVAPEFIHIWRSVDNVTDEDLFETYRDQKEVSNDN